MQCVCSPRRDCGELEGFQPPISGFDRNMLNAFRVGRAGSGERPSPMGGDFTLEEMGQAVGPYRQNGLVYEPVGPAQGQIGYQGSPQIGYTRGPIEGEWYDVQGIPGPRGQAIGYSAPAPIGQQVDDAYSIVGVKCDIPIDLAFILGEQGISHFTKRVFDQFRVHICILISAHCSSSLPRALTCLSGKKIQRTSKKTSTELLADKERLHAH